MNEKQLARVFGVLAVAFLLVFVLYPLVIILLRSFQDIDELVRTLENGFYYERLGFTLFQALVSTLVTVALALPTAVLFSRYRFWGKQFLRSLFLIPFVMPTVVVAIAFLSFVGANGFIPIDLKNSIWIILLAHVFYNYAIVVRMVSGFLEAQATQVYEAARMLGANRLQTLFQVTLPLALPAILAAATLVFIFCFSSFGVILILAPAAQFATLEVWIHTLSSRLLELSSAAYLVTLQVIFILAFSFIYTRLQAKLSVALKTKRQALKQPQGFIAVILYAQLAFTSLLLLSPLLILLFQTFFHTGSFSLDSFRYALESPRTIGFSSLGSALSNSLRFAVLSMFFSLVVGFCFAYAVVKAGWRWLDQASLLPLSISAVTLGLGYLLAFPDLRTSLWGISLTHTVIAFPFVTRSLLPALRSMPKSYEQAAQTLGASAFRQLRQIELPLLLPSFITAASFAFAVSMGEFAATLTLQNSKFATLPIAIFDRLSRPGEQSYAAALALATILMVITGLAIFMLERYGDSEL